MSKKLQNIAFFLIIICSLIIGAIPVSATAPEIKKGPEAIEGLIDITNWNWTKQSTIPLDGQWEFYWQEFLTPEDFSQKDSLTPDNYIEQPRAWNNIIIDNTSISGNGYATYRLVVKSNTNEVLALKIPRILTSYKLWVNGEQIAQAGQLAPNSEMVPQYLPQVVILKPQNGSLEIIVQVANYRHRSGGILESIRLGTAASITELRSKNLTMELFLFGCLFIMGFYHLALYFFRTKDRSTLYFGLFCLLVSFRTLLVGEIFLIHIFPSFNWELAHKIQTLAYYLGVLLVYLFVKTIFPQEVSKKVSYFVQPVALAFAAIVIFTPAKLFTIVNPSFQIFSILVIIYLFTVVIRASLKKRVGSRLISFGIIALFIFSINDIIFLSIFYAKSNSQLLRSIITSGNLSSIGLLFFTFMQSLVLAKRFSQSFADVELLSEKLQDMNATLEEKVQERTEALEASKDELKRSYEAVSRSERSLQFFMQSFSHDLRNPLTAVKGYVTAILDGIVKNPGEQRKYLHKTLEKADYIDNMIQEILEFSYLQSRQLQLSFKQVPVNSFISCWTDKAFSELVNTTQVNLKINTPLNWAETSSLTANSFISVDPPKIERVFSNLLSNAVKYNPGKAEITVDFSISDNLQELQMVISDKGLGIAEEDLSHIFERFYKSSEGIKQKSSKSFGLGLAIVRELISLHGGKIRAESKLGEGSSFIITLPLTQNNLE